METFFDIFESPIEDALVQCAIVIADGKFSSNITGAFLNATIESWQVLDSHGDLMNLEDFLQYQGGLGIITSELDYNVTEEIMNVTLSSLKTGRLCNLNGKHGFRSNKYYEIDTQRSSRQSREYFACHVTQIN